MKKEVKFRVLEDNAGGLYLFIKIDGNLVYGHGGYEYGERGQLVDDIILALDEPEEVETWDGNGNYYGSGAVVPWDDLGGIEAVYEELTNACEIICDNDGFYYDRTGASGEWALAGSEALAAKLDRLAQ